MIDDAVAASAYSDFCRVWQAAARGASVPALDNDIGFFVYASSSQKMYLLPASLWC